MIYDLDKIDFSRHDRFRKTIYMVMYDTYMPDMDPGEHRHYLDKKIELYVNYISGGGMSRYFSIDDAKEKKYKYVIQVIADFPLDQAYVEYLNSVDSQVSEYTAGRVRVDASPHGRR